MLFVTNFLQCRFRPLPLAVLVLCIALSHPTFAAGKKYWELSSYRVQLHVAIDDSVRPQSNLGEQLTAGLRKNIRATLYPLWSAQVHLASGAEKYRQLRGLTLLASEGDEEMTFGCDKRLFVNLVATPLGFTLESRELDCSTLRWGAVQQRQVRQAWMLSDQCFQLICETFSQLATVGTLSDNEQEVLLKFRGSDLPRQAELSFLSVPGEVYQPLMVRTNSAGELKTDSIREIPWTFLTLDQQQQDGWHGKIHTGTRRPFGIRRRGRIEHLALAMKEPTGTSRVRFHARHDSTQGLSGYEVFRRDPSSDATQPLGLTDRDGTVEVASTDSSVTLLFLRSEGQLLAKLPVVPGAKQLVEVPVADDTARLRAQATLTSLTERLIDTVAQRNILITRVRSRIQSGDLKQAQELFTTLDNLPRRANFDQDLESAKNRTENKSADPKVQARIEELFADARKLLGRFLNTKQITDLQSELTTARKGNAS